MGGGHAIVLAGARAFRARRDAAGRAPGNYFAWGEAPGDCSEWEKDEFRLDELPQRECRELVLPGGGEQGAGDCFERENGGFRLEELPQGQRRETDNAVRVVKIVSDVARRMWNIMLIVHAVFGSGICVQHDLDPALFFVASVVVRSEYKGVGKDANLCVEAQGG